MFWTLPTNFSVIYCGSFLHTWKVPGGRSMHHSHVLKSGPKKEPLHFAKYLADLQELQWVRQESKGGTGQVAQSWTGLPATTGDIFSLRRTSSTQKKARKEKWVCLCVCACVCAFVSYYAHVVWSRRDRSFASKFSRKQNTSNVKSSPRFLTEAWPHISMVHVVHLMVKVAAPQATTAQLTMWWKPWNCFYIFYLHRILLFA